MKKKNKPRAGKKKRTTRNTRTKKKNKRKKETKEKKKKNNYACEVAHINLFGFFFLFFFWDSVQLFKCTQLTKNTNKININKSEKTKNSNK